MLSTASIQRVTALPDATRGYRAHHHHSHTLDYPDSSAPFASAVPSALPLVVSYGVGVDSTAMLVALYLRGIRPDLILFADTDAEKPETYAYLPIINEWLQSVGFPTVTTVRYEPSRAPYSTLEGKCLSNETLPSLAFGKHSCSLVFKVEPQNKYIATWEPALLAWASGQRVRKAIGYDNGKQDRRRREKADRAVAKKAEQGHIDAARYEYWYCLQEWGIDRTECERLITSVGLPLPPKSACFFCPASKEIEIIQLRDRHPPLFKRALAIEANAKDGKHGFKTVKGLGRTSAWADLIDVPATSIVESLEILRP